MIGVIAIIRAKDGREAEFERIFADMTTKVKANEPGNQMYQLTRSRTEPRTYKVLEVYADQAAFEAHGSSDHYKEGGRAMRDLVEGRPEVELLDTVS